jgi:hypothetical protein
MINLDEATNLNVYKQLLVLFSKFIDQYPGTGAGNIYRSIMQNGLKIVPKDKRVLDILEYIIGLGEFKSVQELLSKSFSDLPITIRPVYKEGTRKITAFWEVDGVLYNKIIDLINIDGSGGTGKWVNEKGEKIKLMDLKIKEEEK